MSIPVPIARSDIHVHLSGEHLNILFGPEYQLTNIRDLTIPGQFACSETVTVTGPAGSLTGVVLVGPLRRQTQVEISITNGLQLGITPPVRDSGDLRRTPGCTLTGPRGRVVLKEGVIAARRHVHMHTADAQKYNLSDGQTVKVRVPGPRALVFENVLLRVDDKQALEMHVDFDEGHAAGIEDFQLVELIP